MASFDIIESAGKGYIFAWNERAYWARMAIIPILIKIVCYTVVMMLGWYHEYVKQALVMLPSFFAEGWLLSHIVRFVYLEQRWPYRSTGDEDVDKTALEDRARGVLSGTIVYVLINFILIGFFAFMRSGDQTDAAIMGLAQPGEKTTLATFVVVLGFFVASIWAFRFAWLYIPAAVNYRMSQFIKDLTGFYTSIYMIGLWMLCFVPIMFFLLLFSSSFVMPYQDDLSSIPPFLDFSLTIAQAITNTIVGIITTAGMAYGVQSFIQKKVKEKESY